MNKLPPVYVDSNVFIAFFKDEPERADYAEHLFLLAQSESLTLITSALAIGETGEQLFTHSRALSNTEGPYFWKWDFITVVTVSVDISLLAAKIVYSARENTLPEIPAFIQITPRKSISGADAMHIATALTLKCSHFLTFDTKLPHVIQSNPHGKLEILSPDQYLTYLAQKHPHSPHIGELF